MEEAEIVYSEAGEDWKLPVADDDEEDAEETAPAEETSEAPAAVLPAE